jgi:hypothetical protein
LWNILYNSLLSLKYSHNTEVLAFADDLIILKGSNAKEAEMYCNQDVKIISKWEKNNKITFNENKSKVLLISKNKKRIDGQINIFLNTRRLDLVEELKYLGILVYLDRRFTFDKHIEHAANKCTGLINMLSRSEKLKWGLEHQALKTIYKGAIVPILIYGAPVWEEAIQKQRNLKKYQNCQSL